VAQFLTGKDGLLEVDGAEAGKVQSWQYTQNTELADVTSLGDSDRKQYYGVRSGTGTARIFYYYTSDSDKGTASDILNKVIKSKSTSTDTVAPASDDDLKLSLGYKVGSNNYIIKFNAQISSASIAFSQGDVVAADISFQTNGPLETVTKTI
tara:strand:+ start:85 stop:540 length:456 start_codon:yes stop_codon:yes gene_type:complete